MSQTVLGERVALDQTGISQIEAGKRPLTVETMLAVEHVCGVPGGTILREAELLDPCISAESAIRSDPALTRELASIVLSAYSSAVAAGSSSRTSAPAKTKRSRSR